MPHGSGQNNRATNLVDINGVPYNATNPFPVTTPVPSGGPGSAVTLYDASGNPIGSTNLSGIYSINSYIGNPTIQLVVGTAFDSKVISIGGTDGTNSQAIRLSATGRLEIHNYTGTPVDEQIAVASATSVQIPSVIPSIPYRIMFAVDSSSAGNWNFRRTTGTTLGCRFFIGQIIVLEMGSNQGLFVYHDSGSSQNINVTREPIE